MKEGTSNPILLTNGGTSSGLTASASAKEGEGLLKASKSVYRNRMNICNDCPFIRYTWLIGKTCGRFLIPSTMEEAETCGCKLTFKNKLKHSTCPQGKW